MFIQVNVLEVSQGPTRCQWTALTLYLPGLHSPVIDISDRIPQQRSLGCCHKLGGLPDPGQQASIARSMQPDVCLVTSLQSLRDPTCCLDDHVAVILTR
jgi:hypothetical protein